MMKSTFAAACLIGMALADQAGLANDSGYDVENINTVGGFQEQVDRFTNQWGVPSSQAVWADPEDGEGFEIRNTYYEDTIALELSAGDWDAAIFEGADSVWFDVNLQGTWPDYGDSYALGLTVTFADGTTSSEFASGFATEAQQQIELEAKLNGRTDVSTIRVTMSGSDAEYWAGTYGATWKDMDLWVGDHDISLLDDTSDWHVSSSSAIDRDDADGEGKEVQFSYYWDDVWAEALRSETGISQYDLDQSLSLNFDVTVKGGWPDHGDSWKVTVTGYDVNGGVVFTDSRSGTGTEAGEDVHMDWPMRNLTDGTESVKVTLSGTDAEYWAGNYGAVFQGMDLYISRRDQQVLLAGKSASSSNEGRNFNTGFMAGLGATGAAIGLAAFAMSKRKNNAIEDGAFERV